LHKYKTIKRQFLGNHKLDGRALQRSSILENSQKK